LADTRAKHASQFPKEFQRIWLLDAVASRLLWLSTVMHQRIPSPGEVAGMLVGTSAAVRRLREDVELASRVPVRVMIAGELGVGKKRLARLLHQQSIRGRAPFVSVRCGDYESDVELRLFGHWTTPAGLFDRADGGTVFLQDVDTLSRDAQARLMRLVTTGEVQPVGSKTTYRQTNVRVVCATRAPLADKLASGAFCPDLYYQLNTIFLPIPSLRERPEDIEPLLEYFTAYYARKSGVAVPALTHDCRASCRAHHWPGNVRQLQTAASMLVSRTVPSLPVAVLESAEQMGLEVYPA
jgi:DNA-binding NtrC family response regulator